MHPVVVQLIGSVAVIGVFTLIIVFGPKAMHSESWRAELLNYERERGVEGNTRLHLLQNAAKLDHIFSLANISSGEMNYLVHQYSDVAFPNASVLVSPGDAFTPLWNEDNSRGALLEQTLLQDNDLLQFPTPTSQYACTLVVLAGLVPATMICASMVAAYQRLLMLVLHFALGLHRPQNVESVEYIRTMVVREVLVLAVSVLFGLFTLAQASVFGWLESGKSWSFSWFALWGSLLYTGIAHSPIKPLYLATHQMTTWLSLCHFCMILHTSASIGLVIVSAIRCYTTRNSREYLRLSDEEIRKALSIDHDRVTMHDLSRPLYHN